MAYCEISESEDYMEEKELKETLMEGARQEGICAEGYGLMRGYDRDGLIDYYVANTDWCLERGFPSLKMLKREFSDIEDKGVCVGKEFNGELFDSKQTYIFHNCSGTINVAMDYGHEVVPMLYFANKCRIRVECKQSNNPPIVVPLYIVEEKDNKVTGAKSDGCVFKRYTIKRVKP